MEISVKNRIILALDVDELERARELAGLLKNDAGLFKIGKQLFTRYGPQAIAMVHSLGGDVFLDLKFHDIPHTVARAAEEAVRHGVFMFNVHASGGFEMMQQAVSAVQAKAAALNQRKPLVLAVTVLTSLSAADLSKLGINSPVEEQVVRLARLARSAGVDGVVASPHEIEMIKKECGRDFLVVTPGVRPAASATGDQKRVLTPGEALRKGADYIVVGRPVIGAPDPVAAVRDIINEIEKQKADDREQKTD
jgi:orotidine-5'-phosphate decarboxylase